MYQFICLFAIEYKSLIPSEIILVVQVEKIRYSKDNKNSFVTFIYFSALQILTNWDFGNKSTQCAYFYQYTFFISQKIIFANSKTDWQIVRFFEKFSNL